MLNLLNLKTEISFVGVTGTMQPKKVDKAGLEGSKYQLTDASSTRIEGSFFSVAMTTPFEAAERNQISQDYK